MKNATITGWGKCMPPAVLTNDDISTFLDTNDEWIVTRTGMKERRISHVPISELAHVASVRALAAAGVDASDVDLIIFGSCTPDEIVPNSASLVQRLLGIEKAAAFDINTACTSGMYALSLASSLIRTGTARTALVIGAEVISNVQDWTDRNVAVLFGDGAAAFVLQETEEEEGVLADKLGCLAESRDILRAHGMGTRYIDGQTILGTVWWNFQGQEIFKKAVLGMCEASAQALEKAGLSTDQIDLVVPHQANLRIIDAVAKRFGVPAEKVFINIHKYGNMSSATTPVALVEAIEEGYVKPGMNILLPAFGAGLTYSAHIIRWGERVEPVGSAEIELPPCEKTGLELVREMMQRPRAGGPF
ncbi:ketoacyl-ACP synthase III [Dethiobacter alkaliphilus]|uniref:Beta-ketoacyl-[acyl-carrier-protein] synthase III n=1 Tax=Dethiobacter alkaliphilus AHT 1 TaxID=555088 RepID=C0GKV3_DETAL|nr:ketoacyl-ACP synthase III [Dethiobacter alkaliphilus]EEG76035.1 3-oxoacyl-(acyl-carrier-protein) synthase III [Dethiobacter alkaliphilus AHT 1]